MNHGTLIRYIYYLLFFLKRSECVPVFVINSTSSRTQIAKKKYTKRYRQGTGTCLTD